MAFIGLCLVTLNFVYCILLNEIINSMETICQVIEVLK